MPSAKLDTLALLAVVAAQVWLLLWAIHATSIMKAEWPQVVKASPAHVYVIKNDHFWGPVNAIVPKRCGEFDKWQAIMGEEVIVTLSTQPPPVTVSTTQYEGRTRFISSQPSQSKGKGDTAHAPSHKPSLQQESDSQSEAGGTAGRRLVNGDDVTVSRCNETMHFEGVTHLHRYLSMISLSNRITGGTPTAEELHVSRIRSHTLLIYGIIICMILKYSLKVTDIAAEVFGHQYVQLWNQGRTTFDKALESLLLHGVSIIFTLAMQMTLCGLFMTFWREDHMIMTYVPGLGFTLFFGSLVMFCGFMVLDRLYGWMAKCGNKYIYSFWIVWVVWMIVLAVPMIGYCIYSVNFMWSVASMGWLREEAQMFSPAFVLATRNLAKVTGMFVFVAVADMAMILMHDLSGDRQ